MEKIEKANFEIFIKNEGQINITLDSEYKRTIKMRLKGVDGTLRFPIELDKEAVEFIENNAYGKVIKRTGFNILF